MGQGLRAQLGVEPADGLGDTGPAMIGSPAHGLAPEARARPWVEKEELESIGERARVSLGNEIAGDAVLHRGGEPAHARGHHGTATGHGLEGDHAEALVVRRHYRRLCRYVEVAQTSLRLGAQEVDATLQ